MFLVIEILLSSEGIEHAHHHQPMKQSLIMSTVKLPVPAAGCSNCMASLHKLFTPQQFYQRVHLTGFRGDSDGI